LIKQTYGIDDVAARPDLAERSLQSNWKPFATPSGYLKKNSGESLKQHGQSSFLAC
jgi:hypothetical protein